MESNIIVLAFVTKWLIIGAISWKALVIEWVESVKDLAKKNLIGAKFQSYCKLCWEKRQSKV